MAEASFLLDTNILVYLVAGASEPLRRKVESIEPGAVVTSSLCAAEALFGLGEEAGRVGAFDRLFEVVRPLPFDLAAAKTFPTMPFRRGRLDRLIAAHTLALGLVLITNNEADFADIPGLKLENWTRE